jgi:hypothetical protein
LEGGGVAVFDVDGGRRPTLEVEEGRVESVAYGPGGELAVGSFRGVTVFDPAGLNKRVLEVKEGHVTSVAYGPGGQLAAGFGNDSLMALGGGVAVFDASGLRARTFQVSEGRVQSVAYGPESQLAAGYFRGGTSGVAVYNADPAAWLREAAQVANRNLTREEWREYFPDEPYRRSIRSLAWPHDLSVKEKTKAEEWERSHPDEKSS